MPSSSAPAATRAIPYFDYRRAFSQHEEAYLGIVRDIIRRGAFIQQQDLADFETHLGRYLGAKHAIGVGNATDGLVMALRAAGVRPGDEVIFPSHTMVATAAAAAHVGAIPVPVDCGADHLMDAKEAEAAVGPKTRAIMPVQLNGRTCDMDAIGTLAKKHGLIIVEDAAQALGSRFKGRAAGTFGAASAISFYPAKILGCLGDGGAVVTNDDAVADRVKLLRDHGRDEHGDVLVWGFNSRLDNLQAAVLDWQFKDYAGTVERRRALAARYQELLGEVAELVLPPAPNEGAHFDVFQNYEIEAERRDGLKAHLAKHGIGTLLPWGGKAVHQHTALGLTRPCPKTDALFERVLMLPMNTMISDDDAEVIAARIREFYGR